MSRYLLLNNSMITLTSQAADKINQSIKERGYGLGIRISIKPNGCSGLSYILDYVDTRNSWDDEYKTLGVSVFVSPLDAPYTDKLIVDHVVDGMNERFEFINPDETGRCGCGKSFTI